MIDGAEKIRAGFLSEYFTNFSAFNGKSRREQNFQKNFMAEEYVFWKRKSIEISGNSGIMRQSCDNRMPKYFQLQHGENVQFVMEKIKRVPG